MISLARPIIGISGNDRIDPTDGVLLAYTAKGYAEGVQAAGGLPFIIPVSDPSLAEAYVSQIDKLIITGGQNVMPEFYGEEKTIESDDYHIERDRFELTLISEAIAQGKPIFTVCRGTQLFNVAMGGTLHQEIENHWQDNPAEYTAHEMVVDGSPALEAIYGKSSRINSYHHQSIKSLGFHLRVCAYDPWDQTIEAIESTIEDIRYLGVQWHPEFMLQRHPRNQKLFDYIVNEL